VSAPNNLPQAPVRVLSTLNLDGSRRWIRPKPEHGAWWLRRRAVAGALMLVFFLVPYLRLGGKPLVLLDLPRREFTLFGYTFLSTDMLLFALLLVGTVIGIFLVSALLGRAWCGWACPQTVYLEFLFRPVERRLEGGYRGSQLLDARRGLPLRRALKYLIFLLLSMFLAHTFLAYFVGVAELARWVTRSPVEHPTTFFIMLGTTALILFDFAYFREQTCLVACPYGRLQSVLLDPQSVIVGYEARRGEPRARGLKGRPEGAGDCIDCGRCTVTCPTGIDIRDGLQMECIHCTQCADACDAVMLKIGKPPGLIRYTSGAAVEGRPVRRLRPRVVMYVAALAATLGPFGWLVTHRTDTEVTLLRPAGAPYTREPDGSVVNPLLIKVTNRGGGERRYRVELEGLAGGRLIAPLNPLPVAAGRSETAPIFVVLPGRAEESVLPVTFRVSDGARFRGEFPYRLVAPEREAREREAPGRGAPGRGAGGRP